MPMFLLLRQTPAKLVVYNDDRRKLSEIGTRNAQICAETELEIEHEDQTSWKLLGITQTVQCEKSTIARVRNSRVCAKLE